MLLLFKDALLWALFLKIPLFLPLLCSRGFSFHIQRLFLFFKIAKSSQQLQQWLAVGSNRSCFLLRVVVFFSFDCYAVIFGY